MRLILMAAMAALLTFSAVGSALACEGPKANKTTAGTTATTQDVKKGS